jgi:hypothetical protein
MGIERKCHCRSNREAYKRRRIAKVPRIEMNEDFIKEFALAVRMEPL